MKRDLGLPDQYEKQQIDDFRNPAKDVNSDKMLNLLHRLARRDTASSTTLMAIRKLSRWKQALMLMLDFRILTPFEWKGFKAKFEHLRDRSVKLVRVHVQLPFANRRHIKKEYVTAIREVL